MSPLVDRMTADSTKKICQAEAQQTGITKQSLVTRKELGRQALPSRAW
jgi:hypothetical protein